MTLLRSLLPLALVLTACPPVVPGADGGVDGGASSTGGGGGGGGGGGSTGGGSGQVAMDGGTAFPPEWVSFEARVSGRTGRDLALAIKGKDRNLDLVSVSVRLLDANGGPGGWSGSPLLANKRWVVETLTASATVTNLFVQSLPATQVAARLIDSTGLESPEVIVPLTPQPIITLGSSCDPTFVQNRCETGLACSGATPTCVEGKAPEITRIALFKSEPIPAILMTGTEPEDDLTTIRFSFQNAAGQAISIDSDGDGVADLASFDFDASQSSVNGSFFIRLEPAVGIETQIAKLVATPIDSRNHFGAVKTVAPTSVPIRSNGQTCDIYGFEVCGPMLACLPGTLGATNKCAPAPAARAAQCMAAPVLVATPTGASYIGEAEGGSLWDAPMGCVPTNPVRRPEGIVKVRLTDRANKLTLSTVGPATSFDTTLYVLPGCPDTVVDQLGCNDDSLTNAPASELTLMDLPAGDYLVVVDSFGFSGGSFQLTAKVE